MVQKKELGHLNEDLYKYHLLLLSKLDLHLEISYLPAISDI